MDYARHIERICKIEDIEIQIYTGAGRGDRRRRRIKIKPVRGPVSYAIALHEIGHVLGPRQTGLRLDQEVGAWEWAMQNALEWTEAMTECRIRCLRSYLDKATSSSKWKTPTDDHPIHSLL